MASSSEGRRGEKPPTAVTPAEGKPAGKKKKVVRMSLEQIASYLSYKKPEPIPIFEGPRLIDALSKEFLARLPKDAVDKLAAVDLQRHNRGIAEANEMDDDLAREAEDVRRQYLEKGYVEYKVDEEEDAPAPPAPGRRRHRPGVSRKSGMTKRIN